MDCSLPGSSVHGILQARILGWVAICSSRGSFQPRHWTRISCIAGRFFTDWATREDQLCSLPNNFSFSLCPSLSLSSPPPSLYYYLNLNMSFILHPQIWGLLISSFLAPLCSFLLLKTNLFFKAYFKYHLFHKTSFHPYSKPHRPPPFHSLLHFFLQPSLCPPHVDSVFSNPLIKV